MTTFNIQLQGSASSFTCGEHTAVLQAGLDAGVALPFSCRSGMCMTCRGRVLEGSVAYGGAHEKYLPLEDRAKGFALLCCATPLSDLVVEVASTAQQTAVRKYPTRVLSLVKKSDDVVELTLGLPPNEPVHFRAGQFVDFLLNDGARRSYSIATMPRAQGVRQLAFHIRLVGGGRFTPHVFNGMKVRDLLHIEMPLGSFYLREDSQRPIILLASGTGFAPIKSILSILSERYADRAIHLYWGGRQKQDIYDGDFVVALSEKLKNFRFTPVLSEAAEADAWRGRTGFVHHAVMQDHPDLSEHDVYACGAPIVVDSARRDFTQRCHLSAEHFYADSFITEAEKSAT